MYSILVSNDNQIDIYSPDLSLLSRRAYSTAYPTFLFGWLFGILSGYRPNVASLLTLLPTLQWLLSKSLGPSFPSPPHISHPIELCILLVLPSKYTWNPVISHEWPLEPCHLPFTFHLDHCSNFLTGLPVATLASVILFTTCSQSGAAVF